MTEQLFNARKAIETLASGAKKIYGLFSGQGPNRQNDMACGSGHIIPVIQALWLSINLHSAPSESNWQMRQIRMLECTLLIADGVIKDNV